VFKLLDEEKENIQVVPYELKMDYSHLSMSDVFSRVLPASSDFGTSFETIGHIGKI
jgi:hypothetical protein